MFRSHPEPNESRPANLVGPLTTPEQVVHATTVLVEEITQYLTSLEGHAQTRLIELQLHDEQFVQQADQSKKFGNFVLRFFSGGQGGHPLGYLAPGRSLHGHWPTT